MTIYLVTRNQGKLMAANNAFHETGTTLQPVEKDYPEIQADTSAEVARYTALEVARDLNAPAIREDHSIYLNALGIPGPYMAYFDKRISAPMLLDMMAKFTDRTGYFEVATAYAKPSGEVKEYSFKVPFTLATEERGELQKGWSRLIILEGESRTLAEYPETDRIHIWNKNYLAIARDILSETS